MAPYATNTDIAPEFKALAANGGFTSSSNPTAAQVDEWCAQASNRIDAKIGGKYQVPVDSTSSPTSFSVLKNICIWMVASRAAAVLNLQTGDSKTSASGGKKQDYRERADSDLADIQSGKMKLNDAVLASAADGAESFTNDTAGTPGRPQFTRDSDDW